jgi:uncharacterized cupredoxin-like copper-binding protein
MDRTNFGQRTILPSAGPATDRNRVAPTIATIAVMLAAVSAVLIVGLAGRPSGGLAIPRGSHVLHVDEHDFRISLTHTTLPPGNYVLVDTNLGPSPHELVMWKTADRDDQLPLNNDGRVNEDSPALTNVLDSGSSLQPGETRLLATTLAPGRYVLVCNLPGHYRAGMHVTITVQ